MSDEKDLLSREISEEARQDLALEYAWYERQAGIDVAERYLESFRRTVDMLVRQPRVGKLRCYRNPRLKGIRSFQMLAPFRVHLIFYRIEIDCVIVFRVLHGMRDLPKRLVQPPGAED
jgi:toxin ParE1/3/4